MMVLSTSIYTNWRETNGEEVSIEQSVRRLGNENMKSNPATALYSFRKTFFLSYACRVKVE